MVIETSYFAILNLDTMENFSMVLSQEQITLTIRFGLILVCYSDLLISAL